MNEENDKNMHPTLSKGDYFIIDDEPQVVTNQLGLNLKVFADFDGMVFQAREVCPPHVAAAIVQRGSNDASIPTVISLNYSRYKLEIVTDRYADAIRNSQPMPSPEELMERGINILGEIDDEDYGRFGEGP